MKFATRMVFSLLAAAALPFGAATAADYEPPIVIDEAPEVVPVEVGSGWYLRGDISYNANRSVYDVDISFPGLESDHQRFGVGGGVGYHFTDYLRADLNLAYIGNDEYSFKTPDPNLNFENRTWSALANLYVDLGTIAGFTPYVGAGAGALVFNSELDAGFPGFGGLKYEDNQARFAYAANAGVAYRVAKNASIDVGYQYINAPDMKYLDDDTLTIKKGVDIHQVRVGLRYDLW